MSFLKAQTREFSLSLQKYSDFSLVFQKLSTYFEKVDSPTSLACFLLLKYGEFDQYLSLDPRPEYYLSSQIEKFRLDQQCCKLFSKYEDFPSSHDVRQVAVTEFFRCERKCRILNRSIISKGFRAQYSDVGWRVITLAQRKIADIMGVVPDLSTLRYRFGPGQNVGFSNNRRTCLDKLNGPRTVTKECLQWMRFHDIRYPSWDAVFLNSDFTGNFSSLSWEETFGSKLTFVPKNCKTDRPICVEPLMNSYFQLGVGDYLKNRAKRYGIDLRDQTHNQKLARIGSIHGNLATVDLKSASDTISYMVVLELLPKPWFDLLDDLRSKHFAWNDAFLPFEKFSSMGNGFTFELESIIFYSITWAVGLVLGLNQNEPSVFGDDIVCDSSAVPLLTEVLSSSGFEVNRLKSYHNSLFRESCGKDFFLGVLVRPVFIRKRFSAMTLMSLANNVFRMARGYSPIDNHLRNLFLNMIPSRYRSITGPDGFGDGHIVVSSDKYVYEFDPIVCEFKCHFMTFVQHPIVRRVTNLDVLPYAYYSCDKPMASTLLVALKSGAIGYKCAFRLVTRIHKLRVSSRLIQDD